MKNEKKISATFCLRIKPPSFFASKINLSSNPFKKRLDKRRERRAIQLSFIQDSISDSLELEHILTE